MADHETDIHAELEGRKHVYWYTCTCNEVGPDRHTSYLADMDARQHRRLSKSE